MTAPGSAASAPTASMPCGPADPVRRLPLRLPDADPIRSAESEEVRRLRGERPEAGASATAHPTQAPRQTRAAGGCGRCGRCGRCGSRRLALGLGCGCGRKSWSGSAWIARERRRGRRLFTLSNDSRLRARRECDGASRTVGRGGWARCRRWLRCGLDRGCLRPRIGGIVGFGEHLVEEAIELVRADIDVDVEVDGNLTIDRRRGVSEARLRALHVPLVGAVLDLAADPHPVHRVRVELLRDHLQAEAERRVADLLLAEKSKTTVDILARDRWLELLEP